MVKSSVKGVRKQKPKKPKSEKALKNDIRARMRRLFCWYSPAYAEAKKRAQISYALFLCQTCGCATSKIELDHVNSVIPVDRSTSDVSLDEFYDRLFVKSADELIAKCQECHAKTTDTQRQERMEHRKK